MRHCQCLPTLPTVIVLASGRGHRFTASGGEGHKLSALLLGRSVLERTLDAVRASGLPWHLELGGTKAWADSIAAGVRACPSCGWLVLPADLPFLLQFETLRLIAGAGSPDETVVPVYQGRRSHPVRFPARMGPDLQRLRGDQGARTLLVQSPLQELGVDDRGCIIDIDTLGDLCRAEACLAG